MSDTNAMFELALRGKLTFESPQGIQTLYDLWDLPLTSKVANKANLNSMAQVVNKRLRDTDDVDFVGGGTNKTNTTDQLRLDILKHVIAVVKAENEAKQAAGADAAFNQKIMALVAEKEDEGLKSMSVEELLKLKR